MSTRLPLLAAVALLAFASCVTAPLARDADRVAELIDMMNTAAPDAVAAQSGVPFLFDAELIVRADDVVMLWESLRAASFTVSADPVSIEPLEPAHFTRVADTFDLETFFSDSRFLPRDATWIQADSSVGPVLFILGGRNQQLPVIYGLVRVPR